MAKRRQHNSAHMIRFAKRMSEILAADEQLNTSEATTDAAREADPRAWTATMEAAMQRAHDIAASELGLPWELGGPRYAKKAKATTA